MVQQNADLLSNNPKVERLRHGTIVSRLDNLSKGSEDEILYRKEEGPVRFFSANVESSWSISLR